MRFCLATTCFLLSAAAFAQSANGFGSWSVYITNDACSDYTWGFDEKQTRRNFAEVVRAHLDQMRATDSQKSENQDRYNMSHTQEAVAFVEAYPERKQELIRRIQEGRVFVSPFYNNTLWGFQSAEGMVRSFYPARRLERDWGFVIRGAEHMEHPALPWGAASILAGSGFGWLSVPYLDYDSTFSQAANPPLFQFRGPDGATIRVVMDRFASTKANYTQGSYLTDDPKRITAEWLPNYAANGYPLTSVLASGTHGDNNPAAIARAASFANSIIEYNAQAAAHPKLVNATLAMFFDAVDASKPNLSTLTGDFGHSWDLWPVTLAAYAAGMRNGERALLAAEALLARSGNADAIAATRAAREQAEWNWIMLADHAWNGADDTNRRANAELRRTWSSELNRLAGDLSTQAWSAAGLSASAGAITVFNSLSVPRAGLVRVEAPAGVSGVVAGRKNLPSQIVEEDGKRHLYFVSPQIDAFGFQTFELVPAPVAARVLAPLRATSSELESARYRLRLDPTTGGIASLVDQSTGRELRASGSPYSIGQTVYFDGAERVLSNVKSEVETVGPVLARLRVTGSVSGIDVVTRITLYGQLDRVDFDVRVHRPVSTVQQRLTHMFPVHQAGAVERVETMGAVERPEVDLLPGADKRRMAVQGFVDSSLPSGAGVTVAPMDAYALRRDLGAFTFEALGNDQNYNESVRDQGGVTDFQFRYALRAHRAEYNNAETVAWSKSAATPLVTALGRLARAAPVSVMLDPRRAIAMAFKPAEGQGAVLRIWETAGRTGPIDVAVPGFRQATVTDLVERDQRSIAIVNGMVTLDLAATGFAAIRLVE